MLTQERLKQVLHYNPDTGAFTRLNDSPKSKKGSIVGYTNGRGWLRVKIDGKHYKLHRLAFLYMEGNFPPDEVDHINDVRSDNRWCNLRKATKSQNRVNMKSGGDSSTGYRGVKPYLWGYRATVVKDYGKYHSGVFETAREAHLEYCKMAKALHGEFARFD